MPDKQLEKGKPEMENELLYISDWAEKTIHTCSLQINYCVLGMLRIGSAGKRVYRAICSLNRSASVTNEARVTVVKSTGNKIHLL